MGLLVNMYISSGALREGAEFGTGTAIYMLPSAFFKRNQSQSLNHVAEMTAVLRSLEQAMPETTVAALCGLHSISAPGPWSAESTALAMSLSALGQRMNFVGATAPKKQPSPDAVKEPKPPTKASKSGKRPTRRSSSVQSPVKLQGGSGGVKESASTVLQRLKKKLPKKHGRLRRRLDALEVSQPQRVYIRDETLEFNKWIEALHAKLDNLRLYMNGHRWLGSSGLADLQALERGTVPESWRANPNALSLPAWTEQVITRHRAFDKILGAGFRVPSLSFGTFSNPIGVLSVLQCEALQTPDRTQGFKAEITGRGHEHLREPPAEGVFLHDISLHDAIWEAPPGELREAKGSQQQLLPVVHVSYLNPVSVEVTPRQENSLPKKQTMRFGVTARSGRDGSGKAASILEVEVPLEDGLPASRLVLRGVQLIGN